MTDRKVKQARPCGWLIADVNEVVGKAPPQPLRPVQSARIRGVPDIRNASFFAGDAGGNLAVIARCIMLRFLTRILPLAQLCGAHAGQVEFALKGGGLAVQRTDSTSAVTTHLMARKHTNNLLIGGIYTISERLIPAHRRGCNCRSIRV